MYLTKEEEKILNGEFGESLREALKMLVCLGEYHKAEKLIPIRNAHIAGTSFETIGKVGLEWLQHLKSIKAKKKKNVKATTNPIGMDLLNYKKMGIDENSEFYKNQMSIIECLLSIGLEPTWSCSAFLHLNLPYKAHVAFAESHLSCFANSQGIRTNRESGASALYSAILGKTPKYGYHLDENRKPTIRIAVDGSFKNDSSIASALGYWIGKELRKEAESSIVVPLIDGNVSWLNELYQQESLAAGLASISKINCFHIKGITKEVKNEKFEIPKEKMTFTKKELIETYSLLSDPLDEVDIIFIGCPHLSPDEFEKVYSYLDGKVGRRCWLFTGRNICQPKTNYLEIFYDTCMVVSSLKQMGFKAVATNSAKAAHYLRTVHGLQTIFTDLKGIAKIAKYGKVTKICKPPNLILNREFSKRPLYLCPEENKVISLEIYGSKTESTAFGSIGKCPECKGFVFKI